MKTLKIYSEFFQRILDDEKSFEIRKTKFNKGDKVKLIEINKKTNKPTGRDLTFTVDSCSKMSYWEKEKFWVDSEGDWGISKDGIYDGGAPDYCETRWFTPFVWQYLNDGRPNYVIDISNVKSKYGFQKPIINKNYKIPKKMQEQINSIFDYSKFNYKLKEETDEQYRKKILDHLIESENGLGFVTNSIQFEHLRGVYKTKLLQIFDSLSEAIDYIKNYDKRKGINDENLKVK